RVVFWPGVASGVGAPTDQPGRIAEHFVGLGAPLIHVVDFDGARRGAPANTDALGAIAARVATPLQLAGGVDSPDAIQIAFAAGVTRVVTSLAVADDSALLRACLEVAGDWLAVGVDARPERLAAFAWHRAVPPTLPDLLSELAGHGVRRFVLGHATGEAEIASVATLARTVDRIGALRLGSLAACSSPPSPRRSVWVEDVLNEDVEGYLGTMAGDSPDRPRHEVIA
ncbi:MAG: HisA/HisF-related TIM barrel protein, partial [Chloroflexi bacterium]|nr:HisA/HisF-related TIM barrel protein [Chloroflexota bacterium]